MRQMIVVIIFVGGGCLFDFWTRLSPPSEDHNWNKTNQQSQPVALKILAKSQADSIRAAIGQFDVIAPPPVKLKDEPVTKVVVPEVMSTEQQNKQSGNLDELFDGVNKFTLRATFNDNGQRFALLEKEDQLTRKREKVVLRTDQSIANYTVGKINNTAITLKNGERIVKLQLFLQQHL
jgi:hypothetical protein